MHARAVVCARILTTMAAAQLSEERDGADLKVHVFLSAQLADEQDSFRFIAALDDIDYNGHLSVSGDERKRCRRSMMTHAPCKNMIG